MNGSAWIAGAFVALLSSGSFAFAAQDEGAEASTGITPLKSSVETDARKADCRDMGKPVKTPGGTKRTIDHPSVTQTVYCAPTTVSSETSGVASTTESKEKEKGGGGEKTQHVEHTPPTDQMPGGTTTVEIGFKDVHIKANSPKPWVVILAIVVAIAGFIAAAYFLPKHEATGGTIGTLMLVVGVGVASYWAGSWMTSRSCADEVKASVEVRGIEALRTEAANAMNRTLFDENARLRQELGGMRAELRVAENAPHPPPSWFLATATGLLGLALGLLPMGAIGVRATLRLWRERFDREAISRTPVRENPEGPAPASPPPNLRL